MHAVIMGEAVANARQYFNTGVTLARDYRQEALAKLRRAIVENEADILQALNEDLGKSRFEGYMCEIGLVLDELSYAEKHLAKLMRPKKAITPLAQFAAKSFVCAEPYGVALIMSPWNYPFMLTLDPLIGAIAAGNCAIVKPSAYAKSTSAVIKKILSEAFDSKYISVIEGGRAENAALLEERFDVIFFTGSVNVGKLVMEKASANLTPVLLELGGKSPCIVDETANMKLAAKRIVFGKFLNCGQTCVAPDYLLVHESVKDKLIEYMKLEVTAFFSENPLEYADYGHIVNEHHFKRLMSLMDSGKIIIGGKCNSRLQIEPTILDEVSLDSPVMQEEIFGPILPIISFNNIEEAINIVKSKPKPLALYLFTTSKVCENNILRNVSFGGGCVNDTIIHLATTHMGFGGVGESGMGSYHGALSFGAFSHYKSIVRKANFIDMPIRYQPYTKIKERLLRLFMR